MIQAPEFLKTLLTTPVGILGAGVSGGAAAGLVRKLGGTAVLYGEENAPGVRNDFKPGGHALVIFSPGFTPGHGWIVAARSAGAVCLAELDFASLFWRGRVVAVTGTNGKTTVTAFLTYALNAGGHDAVAVGNIGTAFSQVVADRDGGGPESYAICEVSSFQAEALRHFRADAAIWTNFAEDHLERHSSMADYFNAKWHLFERCVGGAVFAGSSVRRAAEQFGQTLPEGVVVDTDDGAADLLLGGTDFYEHPHRENFMLAAAWWRAAGLREPALYAAAQTFELGPHRQTKVGEHVGVTWWNDSKATNFHAVEAALRRFGAPVILIAGGKAKGGDIAGFVQRIAPRVREVLLMGETRNILATFFGAASVPHRICENLHEAVTAAAAIARPGEHVLLSPGFGSQDQFASYAERGAQFETAVHALTTRVPAAT